jgi:N-acetylglutamate synthase-like GNAT family acetyltransferase
VANYTIIEHDGVIFACAALYPYPEARTAEMAALTVSPQSQGQGDGEKVLKRIEQRAAPWAGQHLCADHAHHALVHQARLRQQVDPDWLPEARKRKYNWDRKSQVLVKNKSVVARVLAQYFIDKDRPFIGFDTDRSHTSFTRFYADYASPVLVDSYEGLDKVVSVFDGSSDLRAQPSVIVDLAAQTAAPLARWIKRLRSD